MSDGCSKIEICVDPLHGRKPLGTGPAVSGQATWNDSGKTSCVGKKVNVDVTVMMLLIAKPYSIMAQ